MNIDDLDLVRFDKVFRVAEALKIDDLEGVNEIASKYIQEKMQKGVTQQAALEDFKSIIQEAHKLIQQQQAEAKKVAEAAISYKKDQRLTGITFVLTLFLAAGIFFLVRDGMESGGGDAAFAAIASFVTGFAGVRWLVDKADDFFSFMGAMDSLQKQIAENKRWVWHCQRCTATYAYNGEPHATCGRCGASLTKVMGMRL